MEDSFCWELDSTGDFTTKSATWLAHKSHPLGGLDWTHKWIWKVDTMPKIQIFLSQIFHKALLMRGTLFRRGIQLNTSYPSCLKDIKSVDHLFLDYSVTTKYGSVLLAWMAPTRLFVAWCQGAVRTATISWAVPSQAMHTMNDLSLIHI